VQRLSGVNGNLAFDTDSVYYFGHSAAILQIASRRPVGLCARHRDDNAARQVDLPAAR